MKNPRLSGKIILFTALLLILIGTLSSIVYSKFQGFISVSYGKTSTVPLEMIEGSKQVDVLSRTSPSWRRKLSKHIFITIDQELQLLEQQLILHDSAEGQRLIGRVKISLQRMIFGKQKFVRTGREASLASFYTGRTVLEYNLWKLKGLTQGLNMDRTQARGVHRIYALMNKWLIYVAHREINALRKGTLDASPRAGAEPTSEQNTEAANSAFPQISEVAKITKQDFEKADKALSRQPTAVQETAPGIELETLEPQTRQDLQPNLTLEENTVSPQNFEEEANSSSKAVPIPNWMLILGAVGILIVSFLIFRRERKPSHLHAFYNRDDPLERHDQSTEDLVEIHTLIEPGIIGATREEWPNYSETEESVTDSEAPEGIPSQTTVNEFEDKAQEDMTFQLEELTQELENLNAEKEEFTQGLENILTENNSLTEKLDTFHTEKESLEKQLETLHAEKEEFTQGLENILAENDSLTEKLETFHTEKESLERQLGILNTEKEERDQELKTLRAEKEENVQGQENILTENDSLTEKLETLNAEKKESAQGLESILAENGSLMESLETSREEKEGLEKQLENIQSREENLVHVLESTLNENDPLNEKPETFHAEKESLEKQLETLNVEKEELAQEQENILMENNSLMKQLKTSHKEKDHLAQEQNNTYVKFKAMTKTFESTREKNKTLAKEQKNIRANIKTLTKQFKAAQEKIKGLTKELKITSIEKEALTKKLKTAQEKNKTIAKQNKPLANQSEGIQTENNQTTESEHNLTHELEALSVETKDLKEKLESTSSENEMLQKQLEITQAEMDRHTTAVTGDLTLALEALSVEAKNLKEKLESTYPEHEVLAPEELRSADTKDLSFDHDTPGFMTSQTEAPAMNDETAEGITFSVLNSAKDFERETFTENEVKENQDIPSASLPNDHEASHPDAIRLQTILKAAKGFRNINKRLHKIAEARLAPPIKDSPGESKGTGSQKT